MQPIASYLGEIEGIKELHHQRQKRLIDYDYYRRKVSEMVRTPPKDSSKLSRNAEKLSSCEAAHMNVKNELVARMTALLHEKWDFANAPLLQLLDFQRNFYGNLANAVTPFSSYTYESAPSGVTSPSPVTTIRRMSCPSTFNLAMRPASGPQTQTALRPLTGPEGRLKSITGPNGQPSDQPAFTFRI